jgi:hypothetical protein
MIWQPGSQVKCIKTERTAWLKVGQIYEIAEPIEGYHEHPQVLEPATGHRIDMAYGNFVPVESPRANIKQLIAYHSKNCNRLTHGCCRTLRCLMRGGYVKGRLPVNTEIATCEEYETVLVLRCLLD